MHSVWKADSLGEQLHHSRIKSFDVILLELQRVTIMLVSVATLMVRRLSL